jgi:hypothetical protein
MQRVYSTRLGSNGKLLRVRGVQVDSVCGLPDTFGSGHAPPFRSQQEHISWPNAPYFWIAMTR